MRASPVRGAAGLSSGEGQKQVSELFCCLRGTSSSFFLLKMALHSLAKGAHFCRLKMGRCFLNTTFLFVPRWLQSCLRGCRLPPLCSAHSGGDPAAHQYQGLRWLATKRCLKCYTTKAAWPQLQVSLPGALHPLRLCLKLEYLCSRLQRSVWGAYMSEVPLISLLTPIHSRTFGRALHWLPSLPSQPELGKAQKLLVWTKIPVPAAPQIGGIDLEGGKNTSEMLIIPHTPQDTQWTYYSEFLFPLSLSHQASSIRFSMTMDNTCLFLMGIFREKNKILDWVKNG